MLAACACIVCYGETVILTPGTTCVLHGVNVVPTPLSLHAADHPGAHQQVQRRIPKALITWLFQPFHLQGTPTR